MLDTLHFHAMVKSDLSTVIILMHRKQIRRPRQIRNQLLILNLKIARRLFGLSSYYTHSLTTDVSVSSVFLELLPLVEVVPV